MMRSITITFCLLFTIAASAQTPILKLDYSKTDGSQKSDRSYALFNSGPKADFSPTSLNKYIYDQGTFDVLRSVSVQTLGSATHIYSEFGSFLFGPVRMGIGGSFSTTGDTTEDAAIATSLERIMNAGGSLNFNFLMPLYFHRSANDQLHFGFFAQTVWGINPNINDSTGQTSYASSDLNFINHTGLAMQLYISSNNQKARLYFEVPVHYVWGNSAAELHIPDYTAIKLKAGVIIVDMISFYISGPLYATTGRVQRAPFAMSVQVSPSVIAKQLNAK
ncbi:MAG: hypothetical protein H6550_06605 [Chitinophagales bacterium]|nr:hypothetical protein [Chitinophagales bacterium]